MADAGGNYRGARGPAAPRGLPGRLPTAKGCSGRARPSRARCCATPFTSAPWPLYFAVILRLVRGDDPQPRRVRPCAAHRPCCTVPSWPSVPLLLIAVYAWAIQRSTVYSITNRRVVISFGMALPVTFNLPFAKIEGAGLRAYPGKAGDMPLRLLPGEKLSYFVLWPHARPWRMAHTEPMLRCVPDAAAVSAILAAALAEHEALAPSGVTRR